MDFFFSASSIELVTSALTSVLHGDGRSFAFASRYLNCGGGLRWGHQARAGVMVNRMGVLPVAQLWCYCQILSNSIRRSLIPADRLLCTPTLESTFYNPMKASD